MNSLDLIPKMVANPVDTAAFVVAVLALCLSAWSLRLARRQTVSAAKGADATMMQARGTAIFGLLNELRSRKITEIRHYVRTELPAKAYNFADGFSAILDEERRLDVLELLHFYELLGLYVKGDPSAAPYIASFMGKGIEDSWNALCPFVDAEKKKHDQSAVYAENFRELVNVCNNRQQVRTSAGLETLSPLTAA